MLNFRKKQEENIARFGVSIALGDYFNKRKMTEMAYTVGLFDADLSEIITFGLPDSSSLPILNKAAKMLKSNALEIEKPVSGIAVYPVIFKVVPAVAAKKFAEEANYRAGKTVDLLQMVWPDRYGKFPWEDGFNAKFHYSQPNLPGGRY